MSRKCVLQFLVLLISVTRSSAQGTNSSASAAENPEVVSTECGGSYAIRHANVKIKSPVTDNAYDPELECLWTLIGSATCQPEITCKDIDLRPNDCENEYLRISDGIGGELKMCGKVADMTSPLQSSGLGRDLFLEFKTSENTTFDRAYKGFTCSVQCGQPNKIVNATKLPPDGVVRKVNQTCLCGTRYESNDRIVGGESAKAFEFPWQAAVVRPGTRRPVCGGSVINNEWILTAAHCFYFNNAQPADFEILLHAHTLNFLLRKGYNKSVALGQLGSVQGTGWNATEKTDEDEKSLRYEIDEIIIHPLFTKLYDYDVALIKVDGKIPLAGDDEPIPICLPPVGAYATTFVKVKATVIGWGQPHEDARATTRILQKLMVPVLRTADCQRMLPGHSITKRMMCAGFKSGLKDACFGDSGGPLIAKLTKWQFTQIGIVSWGEGCARKNSPGFYSRLTDLVQWVLYHTRRSGATWCKASM